MRGWKWAVGAVVVAAVSVFAAIGSGSGETAVSPFLPLLVVLIIALPVVSFRAWNDQSRVPR